MQALVTLRKARPDVQLPPPEAVAHVVQNLQAEAARREAEAEAARLAAEEAGEEGGDGAPNGGLEDIDEDEGIEEIVVEDTEGTIL